MITRKDMMRRCGLDPAFVEVGFMDQLGPFAEQARAQGRGTGRTTRTICDALAEAAMGRTAVIVCADRRNARQVQAQADDLARRGDVPLGRVTALAPVDVARYDTRPRVFVDHFAAHLLVAQALGLDPAQLEGRAP